MYTVRPDGTIVCHSENDLARLMHYREWRVMRDTINAQRKERKLPGYIRKRPGRKPKLVTDS